jgi:hypothetical protein
MASAASDFCWGKGLSPFYLLFRHFLGVAGEEGVGGGIVLAGKEKIPALAKTGLGRGTRIR